MPKRVDQEAADVTPLGQIRAWTFVGFFTGASYGPGNVQATQVLAREAVARLGTSLVRATLPSILDIHGVDSGFGDAQFVYLFERPVRNGRFGIGPSFWIPSASSPNLGIGKWGVGPAAGYLVRDRGADLVGGFLLQSFFSFAGPSWRKPQSVVALQPLFVKDLGAGWSLRSVDATWAFDLQGGSTIMPLSLGFAKVLPFGAQRLSVGISDVVTVVHADAPRAPKNTLKVTLSVIYPRKYPP